MATSKAVKQERFVVVISRPNGSNWARVIAGALAEQTADRVILTNARQALYYGRESGGEIGLAVHGPKGQSRISGTAPRVELMAPHFVADCTEAAAAAWRDAPVFGGTQ